MNRKFYLAALFCLLALSNQVNAQLVIRDNGRVEIGTDPDNPAPPGLNPNYYNWLDTTTTLKVFGKDGPYAAGGHITFGDNLLINNYNAAVGELKNGDSDRLWLHGKLGTYITANAIATDTIMFFDYDRSSAVQFRKDVQTSGVFVQSDERFKENVEPVEGVLESLENLEAVTYTLKNDYARLRQSIASMPATTEKSQRDKEFFDKIYGDLEQGDERYGFLAQNVKEVFPQLVHTDNSGYMYVDYIGLIPILVQSINELRAELADLRAEKQEQESAPMLQAPAQSANDELVAVLQGAKLYQNAPNPWNSETVIRYSLPEEVKRADIYIYNMQGMQLKCIPAQGRGESQVTLTASNLGAGMYLYALVADGALIDSKQMILTR